MVESLSSENGFLTLPISIPPLPSFPVSATHHVYLRKNIKVLTAQDSRSLFLSNIPVDSTEQHFRALFASLVGVGRFETIAFEHDKRSIKTSIEPGYAARLAAYNRKRKREDEVEDKIVDRIPDTWTRPLWRSGSSAVALLADEKSVESVLKAVRKLRKTKKYPIWGDGVGEKVPPLGAQWLKAHNQLSYPGNEVMQALVDTYFNQYNRKEMEASEMAKRMRHEPDEDGFVTVTRGGRTAPAKQEEAEEAKRKMLERQQKKNEETEGFYRHQKRAKEKAKHAAWLESFEEDKNRLKAMREKRAKFRPE